MGIGYLHKNYIDYYGKEIREKLNIDFLNRVTMTTEQVNTIKRKFNNWSNIRLFKDDIDLQENYDHTNKIFLHYDTISGDHSKVMILDLIEYLTMCGATREELKKMKNKHGVILRISSGARTNRSLNVYGFKEIMDFWDAFEFRALRFGHYPEKERVNYYDSEKIPKKESVELLIEIKNSIIQLHEKGIMKENRIRLQLDKFFFLYQIELTPLGFPILKIQSELTPPTFRRRPEEILRILQSFLRTGYPGTHYYSE